VKEKEEIHKSLVDLQTNSAVKSSEIDRINEQIEAFKTRRRELEPQLKEASELLDLTVLNLISLNLFRFLLMS
jgi:chromosome segregation ATPase